MNTDGEHAVKTKAIFALKSVEIIYIIQLFTEFISSWFNVVT